MQPHARRSDVPTIALTAVLTALAALTTLPLAAAAAQDPVIKPTTTTSTLRLAAPAKVVASQQSDGRIRVVWSAVRGAASYSIVRSVPPAGQQAMSPNPTDTVWVDSDVKARSYYYYSVAAVNDAGTVGLRTGAAPVYANYSATATPLTTSSAVAPPSSVVASTFDAQGSVHASVGVRSDGRAGLYFALERKVVSNPNATWEFVIRSVVPSAVGSTGMALGDNLTGVAAGSRVVWRAWVIDAATNTQSEPVLSNELTIPASTTTATTGTSTTSTAPATASATAVGSVVVSMATPAALRVGATTSLTSALGGASATRWLSLDEGIATVDAAGTATGRAAGRAQVLAIGRASDGSVRVTLVQVTVAP